MSTDPCDPEVHRRTSTAPTIAEGEWSIETEGTEATIVRYLVRRSSDHVVRWRAPLGGRVEIGGPVVNDDRVFAVTVGLGEYLHDADRDVALHTLDAATGTRTTEQSLPSTGAISACVGELGSAVIVGIAGRSGLALVNADGEPSWSTNEEWSSCALASLARNVVIAARRIDGVMSGGFLTTLVLHVVTHDGQLVETLELPERRPGDVAIRADENGAWLSWASGLWERKVLRLDSQGHPDGEPRSIGTLYFFPDTRLVTTSRGPSLAWSTAHEEGLIPLCWTEPEPPELVVPRSEAWP